MKTVVELEFNENDLGPKWMNLDNLEILLYTEAFTRRDLLKVISFEEESPNKKLQTDTKPNCFFCNSDKGFMFNCCSKCGKALIRGI